MQHEFTTRHGPRSPGPPPPPLTRALAAGRLAAQTVGLRLAVAVIVVVASIALFASVTSTAAQTSERMGAVDDEGIVGEGDDGVDGPVDSTPTQTCVEEGENLGTLMLGATVERSGELSDGDCRGAPLSWWDNNYLVDRFAFELNERGSIRIDLVDTGTASGSFDPFLVLNQGSQYVAENDDGGSGTNARLQFELDTGSYQIVVTNRRSSDDVSAQYRLTVSFAAPCEPERLDLVEDVSGAALTRTGEFAASGCIVHTYWNTYTPGAAYLFELAEPRSVQIDLQGLDGINSYLRLRDGPNTRASDDDAGPGRDASIRAVLSAGEYRIDAGSVSDGEGTGRYRLTLTVDAAPSCDEDQLGLVHGAIVRSGEFGVDGCITRLQGWSWFFWSAVHVFSLAEPGRIQIDLDGIDGVDPTLGLADEQGNLIARDEDGGAGRDARIERELAAGTYRINAQRSDGYQGEPGGRYRLTIDATSQPAPPSRDAGRIVVRRLTDGRTEFGWLPKDADKRILPDRRHLEAIAEVEVGRWISSGPVEVAGVIIGWINFRALAGGALELGFTTTNGERILPRGRWLPANPRADRWLRSTEIEISEPTE